MAFTILLSLTQTTTKVRSDKNSLSLRVKLALEALINDAANDDNNANDTDVNDTNDDTTDAYSNNDDVVGVVIIVGVSDVVGVIVNILCFGSTGLYWSYLQGGLCKTEG